MSIFFFHIQEVTQKIVRNNFYQLLQNETAIEDFNLNKIYMNTGNKLGLKIAHLGHQMNLILITIEC